MGHYEVVHWCGRKIIHDILIVCRILVQFMTRP
jgi:hypothetical protein